MENNTNQNNKNNKSNTTLNETFAPTMPKPNGNTPVQNNDNKPQTEERELLFEDFSGILQDKKTMDSVPALLKHKTNKQTQFSRKLT